MKVVVGEANTMVELYNRKFPKAQITSDIIDGLIKKFEAIPEEKWCVGEFISEDPSVRCAMGHCNSNSLYLTAEGQHLMICLEGMAMAINDNHAGMFSHLGDTPRERVLSALEMVKRGKDSMPNNNYDVDYFIKKFEAIPEENWFTVRYVNPRNSQQMCALGHCGLADEEEFSLEGRALIDLFNLRNIQVVEVNDNLSGMFSRLGDTPKKRILEALRRIKEGKSLYE